MLDRRNLALSRKGNGSEGLMTASRAFQKSDHQIRVLLVSMPWADPTMPSLGLSLLKGVLNQAAISCDILYGNLRTLTGVPPNDMRVLGEHPVASLLYSAFIHGRHEDDRDCILEQVLSQTTGRQLKSALQSDVWLTKTKLQGLFQSCEQELDNLADDISDGDHDVVGFSVVFEQTTASLALASRLKERSARVITVFGGAGCDGPMGAGLLRAYSYVDYAVSGEADTSIVRLVEVLVGDATLACVPGLSYRSSNGVRQNPSAKVADLNSLPLPNYDDYFEQIAAVRSSTHPARRDMARAVLAMPTLPIESSRGCWWGEKHLCSFCGLNGTTLGYRDKDAKRMIAEVMALSEKYSAQRFHVVDNILSMKLFGRHHVLPQLVSQRDNGTAAFSFFFEIKSNLKREQVKMLSDAGVDRVQPGIESFSDHILRLMDKGATGIQQVQLLKWCAEFEIATEWNVITHNPGETVADYSEMVELVPYICHLPPPAAVVKMQLQRFSPYYEHPDRYGIRGVRPAAILQRMHYLGQDHLEQIAHFFDFKHTELEGAQLIVARRRLAGEIRRWKKDYRPSSLTYSPGPGFVRIKDARAGTGMAQVIVLKELSARIFSFCEVNHSVTSIRREFREVSASTIDEAVDEMMSHKLMWRDSKGRCLSLPVRCDDENVGRKHV